MIRLRPDEVIVKNLASAEDEPEQDESAETHPSQISLDLRG